MSRTGPTSLFRFVQVELPWSLGPPDGRYLVREPGSLVQRSGPPAAGAPDPAPAPPTHVIVLATLGASRRRGPLGRRSRRAEPEPAPGPVQVCRATLIDAEPLPGAQAARSWLRSAGERELEAGIRVLNRALQAYRLASYDPWLRTFARGQAIAARVGFGEGEQVADGDWAEARELVAPPPPRSRRRRLAPQARLAATLAGRVNALACEELALRARLDLEEGRNREAALQLLAALDAALAELPADPAADVLAGRVDELHALREGVAEAAAGALSGDGSGGETIVAGALGRLEAALRARAALTG